MTSSPGPRSAAAHFAPACALARFADHWVLFVGTHETPAWRWVSLAAAVRMAVASACPAGPGRTMYGAGVPLTLLEHMLCSGYLTDFRHHAERITAGRGPG